MNTILRLVITVTAISIPLNAATLYVDTANASCDDQGRGTAKKPFCSIQAGYDATADGDELRVMPGTYTECVFLYDQDTQKGVSVRADAYVNSSDNDSTIIDGTGLNCTFPGTTGAASLVNLGGFGGKFEGFTVTGATNSGIYGVGPVIITNNVVTGNNSAIDGGGVNVYTANCAYGSTVTEVTHNDITDNTAAAEGGGLFISSGQLDTLGCPTGGDATVNVEGNTITGNAADGSGGGILAKAYTAVGTRSAEIVITSNTISDNGASSQTLIGQGGGIFGYTYGSGTESIKVMSNIIAANTTLDYGGGISMWIDPNANDTTIDHEIVVADNTLTGNQAGYGGGGIDLLIRTGDFRLNQRAHMHVYGNTITGNAMTADLPDQTFGGGGILAYQVSQNSNSPRIGVLLEDNNISNNAAFGFGGGVSLFGKAVAVPGNPGADAQVKAGFDLRSNAITRNNASTAVVGWDGAGGGVFILLETEGDAQARVDMPLNTVAGNTIDTTNEVGGIHAESYITADSGGTEGEAVLTLNSSIVASNDGIGIGGPSPGLPGYVTPGGGDNFSVIMTYTDLHENEAGDTAGWIVIDPTNVFVDPQFVDANHDYHLRVHSPLVDGGDPSLGTEPSALDIDGDPRLIDGDGDGTPAVDIGCDEVTEDCSDRDGDTFPAGAACVMPADLDCNDYDNLVFPGALQICDEQNNDCHDPSWPTPPQEDMDLDGDTFSTCQGDCDDGRSAVYPGAPQLCDGINNDCNDAQWPTIPTDEADSDADAYRICDQDCNDMDSSVNPGATETCNTIDDNCNALIDEDELGEDTDADGVHNLCDNCREVINPSQLDVDDDDVGNSCDNCVLEANADQSDQDLDDRGDVCDNCPTEFNYDQDDYDGDSYGDACDNCHLDYNPTQTDMDSDHEGDICDLDDGMIYIRFHQPDWVEWQEELGFEAWNSYRGDLGLLKTSGIYTQEPALVPLASHSCDLTVPREADVDPPAGAALFFLTTGNYTGTGMESELGTDSGGVTRPNTNPCP